MAIPGTIQLPGLSTTPSPPPSGSYVLYTKTDSTLNLEDNLGNVYTFGATNAITQLTGDVNAVGPGSVTSTIESIQGNSISGTTGTINVVFSHSPTLTGTITAAIANFSGAISASNFSGSSNGTNTGDVTLTNTNSIDLAFSSGQTGLSANLNLSSSSPDAGYISTTPSIKSDGLFVEIVTGTPVQIGTSNNPGSANSVVYSDHVHSHGAQTDPTLHAIATDSTNGFMSSSDKTKLDSISGTLGSDAQILISNGTAYNPKTVNGDINITDTGTTTIQPNVVSNSKLAQMSSSTLKGNNTGSTANALDLSISQVNVLLGCVTSLAAFGSSANTNAAIISGNILTLEPASANYPGGVSITTQTFAGSKTLGANVSDSTTIGTTSSIAVHQINGGIYNTTTTISSNYTVDSATTDYIIYANTVSNAITITLPVPTNGRNLIVEGKSGTSAINNITIIPHASELINGISSFIISQNYGSIRLTSDGTNWFVQSIIPNVAAMLYLSQALTESAGATTINWANGNIFTLTLNANLTISFLNAISGQTIVVRITNTSSNYTVIWPTVRWPAGTAPTMSAGAVSDVYTVLYDGSNYYGSYVQDLY